MNAASGDPRTAELEANLAAVRGRITAACQACGRSSEEVTLIAVAKTFPAADIRRLAALGLADFGENRDQEAGRKVTELADLRLRWHFVGRLQRNKARSVARYAHLVHAVDRPELLLALDQAAAELSKPSRPAAGGPATDRAAAGQAPARGDQPLAVLVQVNLDPSPERAARRGGAAPAAVPALADAAARCRHLRLAGLMAIAPRDGDPDRAFARLAELAAGVRTNHPAATILSAGMSSDLEAAIRHGATHVRVGTALLGSRAYPVR
jgi:PLP dependent protein